MRTAADWLTSDAVTNALAKIKAENAREDADKQTDTVRCPGCGEDYLRCRATDEGILMCSECNGNQNSQRAGEVRCAECGTSRRAFLRELAMSPLGGYYPPCCDIEPICLLSPEEYAALAVAALVGWTIKPEEDDDGWVIWMVRDEHSYPQEWFDTEPEAEAWLRSQRGARR